MIEIIITSVVSFMLSFFAGGIIRTIEKAIWWDGALKGGFVGGLIVLALVLLLRKEK